jgi:hypothetical protein
MMVVSGVPDAPTSQNPNCKTQDVNNQNMDIELAFSITT